MRMKMSVTARMTGPTRPCSYDGNSNDLRSEYSSCPARAEDYQLSVERTFWRQDGRAQANDRAPVVCLVVYDAGRLDENQCSLAASESASQVVGILVP